MGCGSSSNPIIAQWDKEEQQPIKAQTISSSITSNPMNNKSPFKFTGIQKKYQHNDQSLVVYVYEFLKKNKIRVWMDIKGGMEEHVLDR